MALYTVLINITLLYGNHDLDIWPLFLLYIKPCLISIHWAGQHNIFIVYNYDVYCKTDLHMYKREHANKEFVYLLLTIIIISLLLLKINIYI